MRWLEEIRFQAFELWYNLKSSSRFISEKTMFITLSFFFVSWVAICSYFIYTSYGYKGADKESAPVEAADMPRETLDKADVLINIGSTSEAFDLLATHLNNFSDSYTDTQIRLLKYRLNDLTELAEEGDIDTLYQTKDLSEVQPIQKFVGIINAIDNDALYGETVTVSTTGERQQEQLEVVGLKDVALGAQVEFYGVPVFDTVSSPIRIEAYVPEIIEEEEQGE